MLSPCMWVNYSPGRTEIPSALFKEGGSNLEACSMAFNKYVKLPGSEREPMPGATMAGSSDPNEVMQVTLILRP